MNNEKIKKIQNEEFEMLKVFKKYCEENKLNFMLCAGTLLGAIRHQGFIPWDDDIDICMQKKEYNKLINLAKKNRYIDKEKRYRIICVNDENYFYPFMKIVDTKTIVYEKSINKKYAVGLWLDIFPLDFWPNDEKEQKEVFKKNQFYRTMLKFSISGNLVNTKQKILKAIATPFYYLLTGTRKYNYWTNKVVSLAKYNNTKYVGNLVWASKQEDFFPKEWFSKTEKKKFCDDEFNVPVGWDKYLTRIYGNYMELPPKEKRVFHDFELHYKTK